MIYPSVFEQKIGFDKIRERVAAHCLSPLGEEMAGEMAFSADFDAIDAQLGQTNEFTQIIREEDFPTDHFYDVRDSLKKIRVEGTYLTERELFDVRRSLETINDIRQFFRRKQESGAFPCLQALAAGVVAFPEVTAQIDLILDKYGKIRDKASPTLEEIRRQLVQTANSISKILNRILRNAQAEGLVDKEISPTLRDGRLMIPVSSSFKRKLKGIVHDESATGKTVFIEPAEVVEANNKIRELENEERREIIRILTAFASSLRPLVPEISHSYRFLAAIDFIRAKALFALEIDAIFPPLENQQQIDWIRAIHPLLYLSHRAQHRAVVPLDITLAENQRILLISGPNAGGKSVLLKTVGLLQYMLQCGLLIPISERSKTGIFKDIFLDIGDEQSIENDLSTYSSHLTNMKFMVKNSNPQSLILIDEFGGGTEPQIGGAIAEALLHRFNDSRCFGVITTHYQNLKTYADGHQGVVNGAMLYDRNEMRPLFQLSIGNAGSSFAIEIARKIGLPEGVIGEAAEKVGKDYVSMDKYLQNLIRDKRYWESKRQRIRQQEKQLEELTQRRQLDLESLELQRKELRQQAQAEAKRLLDEANAHIERTIREIKESQAEKTTTLAARKQLTAFKQTLVQPRKPPRTPSPAPAPDSALHKGDTVRIKGQRAAGEVLEIKGKKAVIAFGSLKTSTRLDQLEKISANQLKRETPRPQITLANSADALSEKKLRFKPEIDLRGMRADEALQAVIYFIDDAIQCSAERVRILHGSGTGALRQIVRQYLQTASGIRRFQDEHVQFGGVGVTVVDLE